MHSARVLHDFSQSCSLVSRTVVKLKAKGLTSGTERSQSRYLTATSGLKTPMKDIQSQRKTNWMSQTCFSLRLSRSSLLHQWRRAVSSLKYTLMSPSSCRLKLRSTFSISPLSTRKLCLTTISSTYTSVCSASTYMLIPSFQVSRTASTIKAIQFIPCMQKSLCCEDQSICRTKVIAFLKAQLLPKANSGKVLLTSRWISLFQLNSPPTAFYISYL